MIILLLVLNVILVSSSSEIGCKYSDISDSLQGVLCPIETGRWTIPREAPAVANCGCLLGGNRCKSVAHVPTRDEIPPSLSPPNARNKQYQELATIAEKVVPKTWWRDGFSNDKLLLTHNDSDLPRKLFDGSKLRGKKLKNIVQCVTRQQFIRKSFSFDVPMETNSLHASSNAAKSPSHCEALDDPAVAKFKELWSKSNHLGGVITRSDTEANGQFIEWSPDNNDKDALRLSAVEVLDHFYAHYGGVWTGCFKMEKSPDCRGALAGN